METTNQADQNDAYKPLEEYGVVGNLETVALVGRDGAIDWCCLPRIDSPSVFARLLDNQRGGHLTVAPARSFEAVQTYLDRTNVLETRFRTPNGQATMADFMPIPGETAPENHQAIYRRVTGEEGSIDLVADFEPRFDYARTLPAVEPTEDGVTASGENESVSLSGSVPFDVSNGSANASFSLGKGETRWFVFSYEQDVPHRPDDHRDQFESVVEYWRDWVHPCSGPSCPIAGPWHDLARRSELILKLLIQRETGTIAAAPTTSLPEVIGGVRNWDYRFNWIRDSAFTVQSLAELGHLDEAEAYFDACLTHCSQRPPAEMQPLYGLYGQTDLDEWTLDHLGGYRDSKPVRIGNEAADQRQLDVYGELVVGVHEAVNYGADLLADHGDFLRDVVDHVHDVWDEPDVGIWEIRGDPEQFVYSKVMCWAALDRGIDLVETTDVDPPAGGIDRWREARSDVREAILDRGYNQELGSFVRSFERNDELDAAVLRIPAVDFLPGDDPRMERTIETVLDRLTTSEGLVKRLEGDDGLPGDEGQFVVCSFWLINALVEAGRVEKAMSLFKDVSGFANALGLLAEEIDAETGRQLGNVPQAFSQIGALTSALLLTEHAAPDQSTLEQYPPRRIREQSPTTYPGHEERSNDNDHDR
ncbi:glycoside hydrolase family 15 protein [Halobium palmae]|uniref:Glycoside hydrolase family 15 protein n=1 Tax=Halobium palmae TaxID=1776492 RepID=A0ABD5RVY5_9EURY